MNFEDSIRERVATNLNDIVQLSPDGVEVSYQGATRLLYGFTIEHGTISVCYSVDPDGDEDGVEMISDHDFADMAASVFSTVDLHALLLAYKADVISGNPIF